MTEKTKNHMLKSTSDGELLEKENTGVVTMSPVFSNESTFKRTFTLPLSKRWKNNRIKTASNEDMERKNKISSLLKAVSRVVRSVSSIGNNKRTCAEFEHRRTSQNDVQKQLFPSDKVPGVTGLRNHGNTCFINAVLQCLTHTDCLAEYFVMNQYKMDISKRNRLTSKKYGTKGEVTEQLAVLLKAVWHCQYDPDISNQFKIIVDKYGSQYRGSNQHDAQEFLIWLLDKVHEDLNTATKKNYKPNKSSFDRPDEEVARETLSNHIRCNQSFVHAVFQAQFRSSLTCLTCRRQSNTFDPFLCVSVPIPQQQKRQFYVTVLYISEQPRQVKLGLSLPALGTVRDLREQLSSDTVIPESEMLLTQIDDLGFQRTLAGSQPLTEIRDQDSLYCIQMPVVKESDDLEKCILLVWVNVLILDDQCSRFGSPYTMQLCRLTSYTDLQKLLLKEMSQILLDDVLTTDQDIPLFRIKIAEVPTTHLDPTVDHPLYMEEVDKAFALQDDDSGPKHLKLILEWDLQAKDSTIADDGDFVTEHISVKITQGIADTGASVSLKECLELYTREEVLGSDDKWHCPFCNRKQQVIKKLGLWSLPDILVVHLKRFRQTSKDRTATKLTTMVDCPLYGLDMSGHLVGPSRDSVPTSVLRSPWRKFRTRSTPFEDHAYDLYAVCNHHGPDVQGGHYTAYCRNPYDSQWYSFDDTKVEPVPETDIISPAAYILFYQRRAVGSCQSSSAASSTSSGSNSDHWVTRMPVFRAPNANTTENQSKPELKVENLPAISITSPRPQRKAATPETSPVKIIVNPDQSTEENLISELPVNHAANTTTIDDNELPNVALVRAPSPAPVLPIEESLV